MIRLSHAQAVALMVLVTFLWSIAGLVTRQLETAQSFEVTYWRSFFTSVSLLLILIFWRGRAVWEEFRKGRVVLWLSGLCWSSMFTFFMLALTQTSVATVLVISSLSPLFTALFARIFLRQTIGGHTWVAIALAMMGMVWMFGGQVTGASWIGAALALCVPLSAAANWVLVQQVHSKGTDIDLMPSVLIGALLSTLITLPFALPFRATAMDIGLLALLGLFQLAVPCLLLVVCAKVLKAPEISLLGQLEILFGILLVWLGAGEVPSPSVLEGGLLVLIALVTNELIGWKLRK